jgi:hypothetical protein
MLAQLKSSGGLLNVLGSLQRLIGLVSQGKQLPGYKKAKATLCSVGESYGCDGKCKYKCLVPLSARSE